MLTLIAHFENYFSRKDGTYGANFGFNELTPEQVAELSKANNKMVLIAITLNDDFTDKEKEALESAKMIAKSDEEDFTEFHTLSDKKNAFIVAFEKCIGRIGDASKAVGIDRRTYYYWREKDPEFAKAIDSIDLKALWAEKAERAIDKLLEKDDPNPSAAIFTAKVQAGWQEPVQKIEQKTVQEPITIKIVE